MRKLFRFRFFRNVLLLFPTIILITLLSFSVIYFAPGNAAKLILIERLERKNVTEEQVKKFEEEANLKGSFSELYGKWLKKALKGNFGNSLIDGESVKDIFFSKFLLTLFIALLAIIMELILAFPIALYAGSRPYGFLSHLVSFWATLTCSIPSFWIALIVIWFFTMKFKCIGIIGYQNWKSLIIPSLILAFLSAGNLARLIRHKAMKIMKSSFIEYQIAKGLPLKKVIYHHVIVHVKALVISMLVLDFCQFIGGAVIIESIFNIPGFSTVLQKAITVKDYPVISGSLFFISTMVCTLNLIADSIYPHLDKRSYSEIYKSRAFSEKK